LPNSSLVRRVQEAIDGGSSLAELEQTLLADSNTADEVAAAWLFAWAYEAVRPAEHGLADGIDADVSRGG
jgi:hypothetical protein